MFPIFQVFLQYLDKLLHCDFNTSLSKNKLCCLTVSDTKRDERITEELQSPDDVTIRPEVAPNKPVIQRTNNDEWKRLAKVLDRIFFIAYFFILLGFFARYFPKPHLHNLDTLTRHHFSEG